MSAKSSQIPLQSRKTKPARVPAKWRNLPAYGHGITPAMKARPIIERTPNEEIDGRFFDDLCFLMPVPMTTFMEEHAAMTERGYHALSVDQTDLLSCPNCACEELALMAYTKRHRNGKPNYDWGRDFLLCPRCLHVAEEVYVIRDTGLIFGHGHKIDATVVDPSARSLDTGDSDAA